MTLQNKIRTRMMAVRRNHNREPIGIVVSRDVYIELSTAVFNGLFIIKKDRQQDIYTGDTYLGLDVAVTEKPNTVIVY